MQMEAHGDLFYFDWCASFRSISAWILKSSTQEQTLQGGICTAGRWAADSQSSGLVEDSYRIRANPWSRTGCVAEAWGGAVLLLDIQPLPKPRPGFQFHLQGYKPPSVTPHSNLASQM